MKKMIFIFLIINMLSLATNTSAEETTISVKMNSGGIKILKAEDIFFKDVIIKKGGTVTTEETSSSIIIEDLRGSNNQGWILTSKLKDNNFNGMILTINPEIKTNSDVADVDNKIILNSDAKVIAWVPDNIIKETEYDTTIKLNANLYVPENQIAKTYTTVIEWNLVEGPGSK